MFLADQLFGSNPHDWFAFHLTRKLGIKARVIKIQDVYLLIIGIIIDEDQEACIDWQKYIFKSLPVFFEGAWQEVLW
jgi:hypothetical protein